MIFQYNKIWNKRFLSTKTNLFFLNWIISGILYIKDLYDDNDYFNPFEHFAKKKNPTQDNYNTIWLLEYKII